MRLRCWATYARSSVTRCWESCVRMRGDGTKVLGASAIMVRSQAAPHGLPTRFRQVAAFQISLATPVARTDAWHVSVPPWTGLLRAFWVSAGRAAVARAMPLYFAVLIGAS